MKAALKPDSDQASPEEDDTKGQQGVARRPCLVRHEDNRKQVGIETVGNHDSGKSGSLGCVDAAAAERKTASTCGKIEPTAEDETVDHLLISDDLFDRAIRAAGKVLARS